MHLVKPADVILSDWKMPKIDGSGALRKDPRHRSADEGAHVLRHALVKKKQYVLEGIAAGADEYLTKPIDLEKLKIHLEVAQTVIARWVGAVLDETKDSN